MRRLRILALTLAMPAFMTGCQQMLTTILGAPFLIADAQRREAEKQERIAFHQREAERRTESTRAAYERERDRPDRGRCPLFYQELSPMQPGDVLPAGRLCLARNSVIEIDPLTRAAQLLINLDTPTAAGESSYLAQLRVFCNTDSLSVQSWRTFERSDAAGRTLDSQVPTPSVRITKPSEGLGGALQAICKFTP